MPDVSTLAESFSKAKTNYFDCKYKKSKYIFPNFSDSFGVWRSKGLHYWQLLKIVIIIVW